ncbi:MAG: polyamine aminopropyltransferase [Firmicutes bacterium]|nr:polyamine aminopropyltransferase [Bacillota bacterium]
METWLTENQTKNMRLSLRIKEILHHEQTEFQELVVVDTLEYGRMLVLDGAIQTTERDEFTYHEMIAHVPAFAHPAPKRVCVIGGGDGGTVRELLKHPSIEEIDHVEIDGKVIEASRKYLPTLSSGLDDPRVNSLVTDGIKHVESVENRYDIIIVDSSDPVGPGVQLFEVPFYTNCYRALAEGGLLVAQTESPFSEADLLVKAYRNIAQVFPQTKVYLANVPTYPSGLWSFTCGSKGPDPAKAPEKVEFATKYYTPEIHRAAFTLPPFVQELLEG